MPASDEATVTVSPPVTPVTATVVLMSLPLEIAGFAGLVMLQVGATRSTRTMRAVATPGLPD